MDDLKVRCMTAAFEMASEQGTKFTMSDLAKRLKISKKTIYTVFSGKDELLMSAVDMVFDSIKVSEQEVIDNPDQTLLEKIRHIIIVLPEKFKEINWYQIRDLAEQYPDVYAHVRERLENGWENTIALLEEGIQTGVLEKFSIPVFKGMVEGSMEYFLTSPEMDQQGIEYEEALDNMMDILMSGIAIR